MVQIRADADTARVRSKQQAILRAAGASFRSHGFNGTSMRTIAATLGMTVGNLYYYFDNKQALLAFCQHETLSELLALAESPSAAALSAAERLYWLIVAHAVCVNETLPGAVAHLTIDPLPEPERRQCIERRDRYETILREIVREGVEGKMFRAVDPKLAVWTILGALNGTVSWYRPGGSQSARAVGIAMADHLVRGLLRQGVEFTPPRLEFPARALASESAPSEPNRPRTASTPLSRHRRPS